MRSTQPPPTMAVPWNLRDVVKASMLALGGTAIIVLVATGAASLLGRPVRMPGIYYAAVFEGMLVVAVWRFGPWRYGHSWKALGLAPTLHNGAPLALAVFLASVAFVVLYSVAVNLLGLKGLTPPPLPTGLMETPQQRVAALLLIVVAAPVAEELFFRGFLLPPSIGRWGFWRGASLVSLLFAMGHLAPGVLVPAFVAGLLLAWLYWRTHSLWNCVIAHAAQNAMAFAVAASL